MSYEIPENGRVLLKLISELSQALRCCQQEPVFCEDVSFFQFFILDTVAEKGSLRLADLHDILSVEKSTTTRLVNPLVKKGMIVREKSDHDSRAINLTLTQKGKEVHRKVWECFSGFIDTIAMRIPQERTEEVYKAVRILLSAMRDAHAEGQCCT